jgi:hypothetical protein
VVPLFSCAGVVICAELRVIFCAKPDLEITYHSLFTNVNKGFVLITTPVGKAHQQKEAEKPETPTVKM